MRCTALLAALGMSAFPLSACHVSVGTGTTTSSHTATTTSSQSQAAVPKGDLEQITAQQIREQSGGGPIVITCPGDLPIKLGATEQCVLAQDGKRFHVTIRITKATSPNDATWDWQVGEQLSAAS
ncbi:DUF4333 domain-containing protein [Mycobacterium branderi]|uniref:DUF4333 domain-containing protein n=2 Tax=Mycobacterium branderi TaxID=43348 RepID=A0AA91M1B5_9MYCO|nr:DUF4333 domain-containing protein [Mycobacterium branderi]ORA41545.1 hypothetical protein BST20_05505 [Mycobacterium branderi]